jgi:hypothetical protein
VRVFSPGLFRRRDVGVTRTFRTAMVATATTTASVGVCAAKAKPPTGS